jgi:uncharacterized protein (TIRG00374 family)
MKIIFLGGLSQRRSNWLVRLLGLLLLGVLLARVDLTQVQKIVGDADWRLILGAVLTIVPLILVKTIRWQGILRTQSTQLAIWPAFVSYFSSLFIGFLTPGRFGEFVRAWQVSQTCEISSARAFSSVLADRLFDLYALLIVGSAALITLTVEESEWAVVIGALALMTLPLILFIQDTTYGWLHGWGLKWGSLGQKLFAAEGWLSEMRAGLRQLDLASLVIAIGLTMLAYMIFFGECYLLALALNLSVGLVTVSYAVALGSLVTLLPLSVSGLGTREAVIVAYLGAAGVASEAALAFSLLVFLTFYVGGGLIGAMAWWIRPIKLNR